MAESRPDLEGGNAASWIRPIAMQYCQGDGLDIGCGRWKLDRRSIGVDLSPEQSNLVGPADDLRWFKDGAMDYVFSSHCLEHCRDWKKALHEWVRVIRLGGVLFLYLPHPSYEPWQAANHPQHFHDLTRGKVEEYLKYHQRMKPLDGIDGPDDHMSWWLALEKRRR